MLFCIIKNHAWAIVKYAAMSNSGHNILPLAELSLKDYCVLAAKTPLLVNSSKPFRCWGAGAGRFCHHHGCL